jgi:molybdopterin-guanine dinucleotide biosynthesis protein A
MRRGGIVLAGGRSLRMGRPKAWLDWHGATLLERVVAIVERAVDGGPVVVVSARGQELPPLPPRIRMTPDLREGLGPLQGIASGLLALQDEADVAFVSSTDAALLHPAFVRRVLDGVEDDVDAVVPHARGHRQPLAAGYRTSLAPLVDGLLADGLAKPGFLYERVRTRLVDDAWLLGDPALARLDPALASLENLNEPDDYAAARALPAPEIAVERSGLDDPVLVRATSVGGVARALGLDRRGVTVRLDGTTARLGDDFPLVAGDRLRVGDR